MSPEVTRIRNAYIDRAPQVVVFLTSPLTPLVPFNKMMKELKINSLDVDLMDPVAAQNELYNIQLFLDLAEKRFIFYHWQGKDPVITHSLESISHSGIRMTSNERFVFEGLGIKLSPFLGSIPLCAPSFDFFTATEKEVTK